MADPRKALRINDLIAKIAQVNLKNTTRVLMALDVVVDFLDEEADEILGRDFSVDKPVAEESHACDVAFNEMLEYLRVSGDPDWLYTIRAIN